MSIEPARRMIAVALNIRPNDSAAAHFAGFDRFSSRDPGAYAPGFMLASAPRTLAYAMCYRSFSARQPVSATHENHSIFDEKTRGALA